MNGRRVVWASGLIVVFGLVIAGGAVADWVVEEFLVDIAGMRLPDFNVTSGVALVPAMLPVGLGAAVVGVAVALTRGVARKVSAGVAAALGGTATALAAAGVVAAREVVGDLTLAPFLVGIGGLGVIAGAVIAARDVTDRPRLGDRYDLDAREAAEADEWTLAADDAGEERRAPEEDPPA